MKKQQLKRSAKQRTVPVGEVLIELVVWDFSQDEDVIRHTANELAKAINMHYNINNFGPSSFGLEDGDDEL
jgi:hypothetical protein